MNCFQIGLNVGSLLSYLYRVESSFILEGPAHTRKKCFLYFFYTSLHRVSKNDTDVAHYNFSTHQPILVTFWQRCCWQSTLSNG